MDTAAAKNSVIQAGKALVEQGLVSRTWGNVSCRIDETHFAITPSGMSYERITAEDIVVVRIDTLEYEDSIKPSSEKGVHAAAYRIDPHTNFVIHTHQCYATAMSLHDAEDITSETAAMQTLGGVGKADYGLPGSKRLCANVTAALARGNHTVLMERHGALLTGGSPEEAFSRAALLETLCEKKLTDMIPREAASGSPAILEEIRASAEKAYPADAVYACSFPAAPALQSIRKLPAMIDDFAQMAGIDASVLLPDEHCASRAIRALRRRNCVIIAGIGGVFREHTQSDALAVSQLTQKNAVCFLYARANGNAAPLPLLDRLAMRMVYKLKYSKKK